MRMGIEHHFRKAMPDDFRDHFIFKHTNRFKRDSNSLLLNPGYKTNKDWCL